MLRTAQDVAPATVRTVLYDGLGDLPHFNPDDDTDPLPKPVAELRPAIAAADALLICSPEYAGTLPGSFKNLLDWTVGGTEIGDKPAAWLNAAAPGRGEGRLGDAPHRARLHRRGHRGRRLRAGRARPEHRRRGRDQHRSGAPPTGRGGARRPAGRGRSGVGSAARRPRCGPQAGAAGPG
ncbi:NAD(P)H-dependent oxidoreductase [Streptomyces sp. NBC_00342]